MNSQSLHTKVKLGQVFRCGRGFRHERLCDGEEDRGKFTMKEVLRPSLRGVDLH